MVQRGSRSHLVYRGSSLQFFLRRLLKQPKIPHHIATDLLGMISASVQLHSPSLPLLYQAFRTPVHRLQHSERLPYALPICVAIIRVQNFCQLNLDINAQIHASNNLIIQDFLPNGPDGTALLLRLLLLPHTDTVHRRTRPTPPWCSS